MSARTAQTSQRGSVTINLRASAKLRDLVDRAAEAAGKTRTEFMLEAARDRAENLLLDRRFFELDAEKFEAFQRALDAPAPANAKLRALFRRPAPWKE